MRVMSKMKKFVTLTISLVLILGLVVACENGANSHPDNPGPTESNPNQNLANEESPEGLDPNEEDPGLEEDPEPEPEEPKFQSPYNFTYPDAVRGIYATSHSAGGARMNELIKLINDTSLNAIVIDIKDDHGYITFPLEEDHPLAKYSRNNISDIKGLMEKLEANNIYPIARIVVFKDSVIVNDKPEWSFKENGVVWKNNLKEAFVNPFLEEVWEYNIEIAKLAAEAGFKEIQFDYVRFAEGFETRDDKLSYSLGKYEGTKPRKLIAAEEAYALDLPIYEADRKKLTDKLDQEKAELTSNQTKLDAAKAELNAIVGEDEASQGKRKTAQGKVDDAQAKLKAAQDKVQASEKEIQELDKKKPVEPNFSAKDKAVQLRVDAITDFTAYARKELAAYDVEVAVDIFGYTADIPEAPGIGQNFSQISENVDVICSMIYPSHWGPHYFGIPKPDLEPYRLVHEYIIREKATLAKLENPPKSRPWIQDFSAPWLGAGNYKTYTATDVEAQIRALNDEGVWEFLIWNAGNVYSPGANYLPIGPVPSR